MQREGICDVLGKIEKMMEKQSDRNGNKQAGKIKDRERMRERGPFKNDTAQYSFNEYPSLHEYTEKNNGSTRWCDKIIHCP